MVLIWNPQSHVSLLKISSLSWMERGTNGEGRLIQEGASGSLASRNFGREGCKSLLGLCPRCPSRSSRAGGSRWGPPGMAQPEPPELSPKGRAQLRLGLGKGSWDYHPKKEWAVLTSCIASPGTGFALPQEIFLIFSSLFSFHQNVGPKVPFQPGVLGWTFPVVLFTQLFSLILLLLIPSFPLPS